MRATEVAALIGSMHSKVMPPYLVDCCKQQLTAQAMGWGTLARGLFPN